MEARTCDSSSLQAEAGGLLKFERGMGNLAQFHYHQKITMRNWVMQIFK